MKNLISALLERTLSEETFDIEGGGSVSIKSSDLATVLRDNGIKPGVEMGKYLSGEEPIPVACVPGLSQKGKIKGKTKTPPADGGPRHKWGPDEQDIDKLWARALKAVEKESKGWNDPEGACADYYGDHGENGLDFLLSASHDVAVDYSTALREVILLFKELPSNDEQSAYGTQFSRATFYDTAADYVADAMQKGWDRMKKNKKLMASMDARRKERGESVGVAHAVVEGLVSKDSPMQQMADFIQDGLPAGAVQITTQGIEVTGSDKNEVVGAIKTGLKAAAKAKMDTGYGWKHEPGNGTYKVTLYLV